MAEDKKNDRVLGLSAAQVTGSMFAAVSGALLASFAGTTGTIIGTAMGSVVYTVAAAIYTWSLRRTSAAVRRTAAQVRQTSLLTGQLPRTVAQGPLRSGHGRATGNEPPTPAETAAEIAAADAATENEASLGRSVPWAKVALASVGVTAVVLGGITTFEVITGQTVSSLVGGGDSQGTSVGHLVGTDRSTSSKDEKQPTEPVPSTDDASQAPAPDTGTTQAPAPDTSVTPTPEPSLPADPSTSPDSAPQGAPPANPSTLPAPAPE